MDNLEEMDEFLEKYPQHKKQVCKLKIKLQEERRITDNWILGLGFTGLGLAVTSPLAFGLSLDHQESP